ncbi:MAG: bifunctional diguanylate cyclase/phosphodiesterase [Pseudomonadota bacterium]
MSHYSLEINLTSARRTIAVSLYTVMGELIEEDALFQSLLQDEHAAAVILDPWSATLAQSCLQAGALLCLPAGTTRKAAEGQIALHIETALQHADDADMGALYSALKMLRWQYDIVYDALAVSPALAEVLGASPQSMALGLEAFLIGTAGLNARALLAGCSMAIDEGRSQRIVHPVANQGLKALHGGFVAQNISSIAHGRAIAGLVDGSVHYRDIEALQQSPGILTEDAFRETLLRFLIEPHRNTGLSAAVCMISIDRFEQMNILLGRQIADELLDNIAARLRRRVEAYVERRGDHDTRMIAVCRMGGAQFAVAMEGALHIQETRSLAEFVLACFKEPFLMLDQRLHLNARIGIAAANAAEKSPDKIMSRANIALSIALDDPPGSYRIFDAHDAALAQERVILDGELRDALSTDSLFIRYMPIMSMETGQAIGVEALVRWNHPDMGLLEPALFIPMAEETGAIADIGDWVLGRALFDFSQIANDLPDGFHLAVNISPEQFRREDLQATVMDQLRANSLSPSQLMLEVTESMVIEDFSSAGDVMSALRDIGVRWSVDDFGTGFSALSYLGSLPFDELKLDKRFIKALSDTSANGAPVTLVDSVISIARAHGALVVAEGIETEAQAAQLQELGCDFGQGYFYAEPLPKESLIAFVKASLA